MRCERCGAENRDGVRFCEDCGERLSAACPHCRAHVPMGKRFCGSCGEPLEVARGGAELSREDERAEGEHKPVTALFCDIAGSTALAERVGSEAMHRLLDRFFVVATREIVRFGGAVDKFLGDGVLAVVGAPRAHEDHARRAVMAALSLRDRLATELAGLTEPGAPSPPVRMGLDSGTVVVGALGDGAWADYTAVGDTVNVAARLQGVAQPGEIVLSDATARLVEGYARTEPLGAVELRGRRAPVRAFRLLGPGSRQSRVDPESPLTPFVGRRRQIDDLLDQLARVRANGGRAVGLVGEPGIGKSRLLLELIRAMRSEDVGLIEGRCLSFGAATPYLPVRDIVRAAAGVRLDDDRAALSAKLGRALDDLRVGLPGALPLLLSLLGVEGGDASLDGLTPEAVKLRTFEVVRAVCIATSRKRPLVLVVEDLHWVDATSEALLDSLAEALVDAPILFLCTYRPGYRPPWTDRQGSTQVVLGPLAAAESRSVVRAVLGESAPGEDVEQTILERGEGNPFMLEELARSVSEEVGGSSPADVPDTVQGVLLARIDRLPGATRRVLQTASVLGRSFSRPLLTAVGGGGGVDRHLAELRRLEFVFERPGEPSPVIVFKHALTQDVAYASLLSERRRSLHEAAARALEALPEGSPDEVQALLGHHYSRAGLDAKAVEHLGAAAGLSAARHSHAEAARAYELALEHSDRLPEPDRAARSVDLTLGLAASLYFLGRFTESGGRLAAVRGMVEELDEPSITARSAFAVGLVQSHIGSTDETVASATVALEEAERCGDLATVGRARYLLCREDFWLSRLRESIGHGRRAISALEEAGERWWQGQCHCFLSLPLCHLGETDEAERSVRRGRAIADAMGDIRLQSYATWNMGLVQVSRGDAEGAIASAARSLAGSPDPLNTAFASGIMGTALVEDGRPLEALDYVARSVEALHSFGVRRTAGWMEAIQAGALVELGDFEDARAHALKALDTTTRTGHRWAIGVALRALGRAEVAGGAVGRAEARLQESLRTFEMIGARLEAGLTHLELARIPLGDDAGDDRERHLAAARSALAPAPLLARRVARLAPEIGSAAARRPSPR